MSLRSLATVVALVLVSAGQVSAKEARCFTTDDGDYACGFVALDKSGSFEISARGKPTFQLWIDRPGEASVNAIFEPGGRAVSLPGIYFRSQTDGACWVSGATNTRICAW